MLKKSDSGQSTIEFALTMVLILAFAFFYAQLSLVLGIGNYVQYATFMSARAYLSGSQDENEQKTRACIVLAKMLTRGGSSGVSDLSTSCSPGADRFPTVAKGDAGAGSDLDLKGFKVGKTPDYNGGNVHLSWLEGVRYTFKSRVFFLPLSGSAKREPGASSGAGGLAPNEIRLTSETYLLREPSFNECQGVVTGFGGGFDNGC